MASDLGATPVPVEFRGTGTRQIWVRFRLFDFAMFSTAHTAFVQYVRYIQWFISFPLLLLELLLATGLSLSDVFTTLFMAIVLVVTGLVAALVPSTYKWGYYTFGLLALFYIWSVILSICMSYELAERQYHAGMSCCTTPPARLSPLARLSRPGTR